MSLINAFSAFSNAVSPEDQLRVLDQTIEEFKAAESGDRGISAAEYDALTVFLEKTSLTKVIAAERMLALGSRIRPAVRNLMDRTSDPEIKIVAALMLRKFNDLSGIPILLEALRRRDPYSNLVAQALADSKIQEAGPIILQRIESDNSIDPYSLADYIAALRLLHIEIPQQLRDKLLSSPNCHPYVRLELGQKITGW